MRRYLKSITLLALIAALLMGCNTMPDTPDVPDVPQTEDTTPSSDTLPPEEVAPPDKETVLERGVPYTGELNGTYTFQIPLKSSFLQRNILINEDAISIESYKVGTVPQGAYTGTLNYDPVTGEFSTHLDFKYHDGTGSTVYGSPEQVRGLLYEYDGAVYFLCTKSELPGITPEEDMMVFEPQIADPGMLSVAEWTQVGFNKYESSMRIFYAIRALLRGDSADFARRCGVSSKVYASLQGIEFGSHRIYREEIPSENDPDNTQAYAVLEVEILASESDFFTPGTHRLVFAEGLSITFTPREEFKRYTQPSGVTSPAVSYVDMVRSDTDFYRILGEGRSQFGLCSFIVARLNTLAGNGNPRTEEEIRAYAEKYLGVDGDSLHIQESLYKQDDGYILIGRGSTSLIRTFLSEEIRDGITVVTVQFWADHSKTVPSRKVEFHLELLDGEYRPVKTVILEDSEFATATYST